MDVLSFITGLVMGIIIATLVSALITRSMKKISDRLFDSDIQNIIDALLFYSCVDVCSDVDLDKNADMIKTAKYLKEIFNVEPSDDVYLYGSIFEEKELAEEILDSFKIRYEE